MTRLTWIEATVGDPAHAPLWQLLTAHVERLAAGRASVALRHVSTDAGGIRTPANRLLSDAAVLCLAEVGIRPTDRGYPRPHGDRARALGTAARRLSDGTPSPERTPA